MRGRTRPSAVLLSSCRIGTLSRPPVVSRKSLTICLQISEYWLILLQNLHTVAFSLPSNVSTNALSVEYRTPNGTEGRLSVTEVNLVNSSLSSALFDDVVFVTVSFVVRGIPALVHRAKSSGAGPGHVPRRRATAPKTSSAGPL